VIIATYIFISLVLQNSGLARKLVPLYHVIAWLVPVAIVVAAIWKNVLGWAKNEYTLRWCWISDDSSNQEMWMLLTGKGWEVSAYLVTLILYMTTKCYLWSDVRKCRYTYTQSMHQPLILIAH
jgi:G protein-coupled receptor 157